MNVEKHARKILERLTCRAEPLLPWHKRGEPLIRPAGVVANRHGGSGSV